MLSLLSAILPLRAGNPLILASLTLLATTTLASTIPNDHHLLLPRAIGSACTGTEGRGTCQSTSSCRGISYPQPFCPNDPDDVQCCVEIKCTVASGQSGFCRSVSNNGCAGGKFDPGNYCPGSQDVQCCLKGGGGSEPGVGTSCNVGGQKGTCLSVSKDGCAGGHFDPGNYCPGSQDVQCCLKSETGVGTTCNVGGQSGTCLSVSRDGCAGGHFDPGNYCPGSQDVQCCLKGGSSGGGNVGQKVLAKAKEAAGLPYAWGGGSCSGPTHDNPPWQYGEVGFDCSGLVCWAVCQVTGRDLFSAGLRNTHAMYCASESRLGYKKYPFSQRKAGDAVFFGGACSCGDSESIHHVGLVMSDGGDMMWNAPNDDINRVMAMSISGFGEKPCPNVIRFT